MKNITKTKNLPITPHLGGGVDSVLMNYCGHSKDSEHSHKILCLDYANMTAFDFLRNLQYH